MYKTGKKTLKINEKEYHFHFGMNAMALCEQQLKGDMNVSFMTWARCIIWAGLMVAKDNNMPADFSLDDAGSLIDEMEYEAQYLELMDEVAHAMGKMTDLTRKVLGKEQISKVMQLMASQIQ